MARILSRRLSRLEAGIGQTPRYSSHRAKLVAVLDELANLLASGASPGEDLRRLAVARASEAGAFEASEIPLYARMLEALHERGVKRTRGGA